MSTDIDMTRCAACGEGGDGLKKCTACKMVKYCGVQCQKAHRPKHKKECRKRAAELFDEKLFRDPPPPEDCPVCFIPLPIDTSQIQFQSCCGKRVCCGCMVVVSVETEEGWEPCPFCRQVPPKLGDYEEHTRRIRKRIEANDPDAFAHLGQHYHEGQFGVPRDLNRSFELLSKGAELGSILACSELGNAYEMGWGVEKDKKKAIHYYQLAAMGGNVIARWNLASREHEAGNKDRALKHVMIAARAGHEESLKMVKRGYVDGYITKDDFAKTLRAHHNSATEMKSDQREYALKMMSQKHEMMISL